MTNEFQARIEAAVNPLHGWCTPEKAVHMARLIVDTSPDVVVEIGVFGGRSLVPQAMALVENRRGVIYGVDPWRREATLEGDNDPANAEWWARVDLEDIHRSCMGAIWGGGLASRTCVLRTSSEVAVNLFANETVDILHLDGNHSELCSVRDVTLWLPKLRPLGFVWFDDTDWATTRRAVAMLRAKLTHIKDVGACTLFQRPKQPRKLSKEALATSAVSALPSVSDALAALEQSARAVPTTSLDSTETQADSPATIVEVGLPPG